MTKQSEGIKPTKPKIEIYCKNPSCFTQYLATHKIKSVDKNKEIKEKDFLELKEIVEILFDYELNSTREETTEQYARRIINLIRNKTIQEKDAEFNTKLEQLKKEINDNVKKLDSCLILSSHGDYSPVQRKTWELFKCNLSEVLNKEKIEEIK